MTLDLSRLRVAVLEDVANRHRAGLFRELAAGFGQLKVYVSATPLAGLRHSTQDDHRGFEVEAVRCLQVPVEDWNPVGFSDPRTVAVPLDLLPRLQAYRPHLLLSVEFGLRALWGQAYRWANPGSRLIAWAGVSEHSEAGRGWARKALRRFLVPRADALLVNGASGRRYFEDLLDGPLPPTFLAPYPNPLGPDAYCEREDLRFGPRRVLFLGQLIQRKGFAPLLEALEKVEPPREGVELWVAGDGPDSVHLARWQPPDRVLFRTLGWVDPERLPKLLADCEMLAFPTLADEWGVAAVEALATGMPVLGSDHAQSVTELVTEGENGWRFDPTSPASLAAALDRAFRLSRDQLRAMGPAARAAADRVSADKVAANIFRAAQAAFAGQGPR